MSSIASDDGCSDWASDIGEPTQSLFAGEAPSAREALEADRAAGYDLAREAERLGLDTYGRMRLINLVRRDKLSMAQAKALERGEWAGDDKLLVPVIENDPLLLESWESDDEDGDGLAGGQGAQVQGKGKGKGKSTGEDADMGDLAAQLARARLELDAAQKVVKGVLGDDEPVEVKRDDDTHYFDSYAENDIHEIMLRDTTRTVSYARYILSSPIFKNAVVMDVGCGSGILSMLAARAGARKVYAIEASGLASKARQNIKNNGLDDIITVIQAKVEDIPLDALGAGAGADSKVDVIISEWMGYMLLYESMLDSVLHARDRFLRAGGEMVPGRTRLVLSAITGERLHAERVAFWDKVYGFDMSAMRDGLRDGVVDVVDAKEVVTDDYCLRTIDSHDATPAQLDFSSPFELVVQRAATIRAFLTHFDTFFGGRDAAAADGPVDTRVIGDDCASPVAPVEGPVSFTTGPRGKDTHWKQVAFLLDAPIEVAAGEVLRGEFHCAKSASNSREIDVQLHFRGVRLYRVR